MTQAYVTTDVFVRRAAILWAVLFALGAGIMAASPGFFVAKQLAEENAKAIAVLKEQSTELDKTVRMLREELLQAAKELSASQAVVRDMVLEIKAMTKAAGNG